MTDIKHWEPDAPAIAICACGGTLMLVEDHGPNKPLEAQCRTCGDLSGVSHAAAPPFAAVDPGSPAELGF